MAVEELVNQRFPYCQIKISPYKDFANLVTVRYEKDDFWYEWNLYVHKDESKINRESLQDTLDQIEEQFEEKVNGRILAY